ncbi:MAG: DUF3458 domain-containing protein, partial [Thalassolituus sp.]
MRWDEKVYGREYDLDIFMIVAVDDFNMGAMENKGLNIFNSSCVLANPATATDAAYQRIEAIVAHEYFHNWSGNRVTCRDWFQLSLKEGFTVFRDANFSADMNSATVKRIEDATMLRTVQFAEDGGPMAHPVQPDSYIEISNFYTVTIYEKGAEVVGMLHKILGAEGFRKGSDLYFERHDGQAVTINDFVKAMEDANDVDLEQFRLWYKQAGTPIVDVLTQYDHAAERLTLNLRQRTPDTPGQTNKKPVWIPIQLGFIGHQGQDIEVIPDHDEFWTEESQVLHFREAEQTFTFSKVHEEPIVSLFRDFSAPVRVNYQHSQSALRFLPSEYYIAESRSQYNPVAIHNAREEVCNAVAAALASEFEDCYLHLHTDGEYAPVPEDMARRSLKNLALSYWARTSAEGVAAAQAQFKNANNMTDQMAALRVLVNLGGGGVGGAAGAGVGGRWG